MKKFLTLAFWMLMYIGFLALFAHGLIIHGAWNPLSWDTFYMSVASFSLLQYGSLVDKK